MAWGEGWLESLLVGRAAKDPGLAESQKGRQKRRNVLKNLLRKVRRNLQRDFLRSDRLGATPPSAEENAYERTRLPPKDSGQWIIFRPYSATSQCPACILGDATLSCTCSFRARAPSPDFKLYEDEELYASKDELESDVKSDLDAIDDFYSDSENDLDIDINDDLD
jgi:hypothetical protein